MLTIETYANALKDMWPNQLSDADAEKAASTVFGVISRGLKNGDVVEMEGVGEFRTEPEGDRKKVIFTPSTSLLDRVNE